MKADSIPTGACDGQREPKPGDEILRRIADAIRGVRFGSVEVVIQDSRVVQIERKEKFRLDKPGRGIRAAADRGQSSTTIENSARNPGPRKDPGTQ